MERGSGTSPRVRDGSCRGSAAQSVGMAAPGPALRIVPADEASVEDLRTVFGRRGAASRCWCQRFKLGRGEAFADFPVEERIERLREQAGLDHSGDGTTCGLVAHVDEEPVGWCAVEPRPAYVGLVRNNRVPWTGRDEDRADASVWAVTCLFVRAGHRRQGLSGELARAAVAHARERGARAVEAYPITTKRVIDEELLVGTERVFAEAGLTVVSRPTPRRLVMRIDF